MQQFQTHATTISRRAMLALGAAALMAVPAAAQVNFAGKTIEWIVPFSPGGGSGVMAEYNAPFLSKYLPGNPTVVLVYEPGGGSTRGANLFAARAKPDGLTLLVTSGSTQFPYLLNDPRVRYEYNDWHIFLAGPTGGVAYTTPKLGLTGPQDIAKLKGKQLIYASQGATSLDLVPLLGFRLLGLDVKHVFGFKGRADGRLAFERGETNIDYQTSSAYIKNVTPLVQNGSAVPLFSWGVLDEAGNLVRDPNFPDLPHIGEAYEMVHGRKPSGPEWDAFFAFLVAGFPAQKMAFLPKGTSPEIVEAYRAAVRKMLADPDYNANKGAAIGEYEQVTDKAAEALFRKGTTLDADSRKRVAEMLMTEFKVKLGED